MTTLDSMTARHAAGQPLTAEEVGWLLSYTSISVMINERGWCDTPIDEILKREAARKKLTAPAPAPQPEPEPVVKESLTTEPEQKVCEWAWANGAWVSGCKAWARPVPPLNHGQTVCRCGLPICEVGGEAKG